MTTPHPPHPEVPRARAAPAPRDKKSYGWYALFLIGWFASAVVAVFFSEAGGVILLSLGVILNGVLLLSSKHEVDQDVPRETGEDPRPQHVTTPPSRELPRPKHPPRVCQQTAA